MYSAPKNRAQEKVFQLYGAMFFGYVGAAAISPETEEFGALPTCVWCRDESASP